MVSISVNSKQNDLASDVGWIDACLGITSHNTRPFWLLGKRDYCKLPVILNVEGGGVCGECCVHG